MDHYSTEYSYSIRDRVPILYDPSSTSVRVDSFLGIWGVSLLVVALGAGMILFGLILRRMVS